MIGVLLGLFVSATSLHAHGLLPRFWHHAYFDGGRGDLFSQRAIKYCASAISTRLELMESFSLTQFNGGFRIEGFPDAVRFIKLDHPQAQRIADLALHLRDLIFDRECLESINTLVAGQDVIREALWRSAVIHLMKCFGTSASRFQLSADKIFKTEPPEAKKVFEYFQHLRDKHLAHDENSYSTCIPGAVVNRGDAPSKIAKIITFGAHTMTLDQTSFANLMLLIKRAHDWVISQYDLACDRMVERLEAVPYSQLTSMEEVVYSVPTVDEIGRSRPR